MKTNKKKLVNFYIDPKLLSELKKVSSTARIPQSVILREAVKDKVAEYVSRIKQGEEFAVGVITK